MHNPVKPVCWWIKGYIALSFFLISLQSVYFAGGAWLCLLGLAMLVPLARPSSSPRDLAVFLALSFGVGAAVLTGALSIISGAAQLFSMSALLLIPAAFDRRPQDAAKALEVVIAVHVAAIAAQVVWYATTGDYVDYLLTLGVGEQVVFSKKGLDLGGTRIPRFAGLHNEPGTYSTLMCAMLIALFSMQRKTSILLLLGLVSVFVTLSLGGMVMGGALIGVTMLFSRNKSLPAKAGGVLFGAAALAAAYAWTTLALEHRALISAGDTSEAEFFTWVIREMSITAFGIPLTDIPPYITAGYMGAGLDVLINGGVYGLSVLAFYVFSAGPVAAALSGAILLSKLKLAYPLLYVLLALVQFGPVVNSPAQAPPRRGRLQFIRRPKANTRGMATTIAVRPPCRTPQSPQ